MLTFLSLLHIYYRFWLCGYHEALVRRELRGFQEITLIFEAQRAILLYENKSGVCVSQDK